MFMGFVHIRKRLKQWDEKRNYKTLCKNIAFQKPYALWRYMKNNNQKGKSP